MALLEWMLVGGLGLMVHKGFKQSREEAERQRQLELELKRENKKREKERKREQKKREKELLQARQAELNRVNAWVGFIDGITEAQFRDMAFSAAKKIRKRHITFSFDGAVIYGTVQSQSGITTWDFTLDFNDHGHLTGRYWRTQENNDSVIPRSIGKSISAQIQEAL